jgi:O-antigen ligase
MNREQERALLLFVVAIVLIATPVRAFWLQAWWSPFAFWLSMIAAVALIHRTDHAA